METFLDIFNQYARSELMILIPVLYVINKFIFISKIENKNIPLITSAISIILSGIYTFATVPITNIHTVLLAIFTSLTQGFLFAGASIMGGLLINLFKKKASSDEDKTNEIDK